MKDKMVYKWNNVVGALMNVPISVGTFSVVTDFAVLENMKDYRDKGMDDVIFGEPFLREVGIKARRFEGMITLYKGDDEVIEKDEKWNLAAFQKDFKGLQRSFESRTRLHAKCKDGRMVHTRVIEQYTARSGMDSKMAKLVIIHIISFRCYIVKMGVLHYYTKDCPLKEEGKTLKEAYYTEFGAPFQGGGYRATASGFYQRNNKNPLYQERRQSMEETLRKFMWESANRHNENSNLIKEIRASMDVAIRNQGASMKTLEIQIGQMSKVLQERGFGSLPRSTETNPRDHVKSISTIVEADASLIRRIGSRQYIVSTEHNKAYSYGASHIDKSIPRKEKDPGSFTLPCYINNACFNNALADLGASVSDMPLSTYLNLGLGELAHNKLTVELTDRTVKYPKGIAENVLVGISKFVFLVDFIILDMPEDVKVPLILRRPFFSTAHAKIDVFQRNITLRVREEKIILKIVKPASSLIKRVYMLSLRERMEVDLEDRLMGETLVLNRSLDSFFEDYIELNDLNVPLELMRDQVDDLMPTIEEGEVIKEFRARNDARMDLSAKKWTKLVKYQSSGILCVIVVMLEYRRMFDTHLCS
ncbi:mitochondrial proton/calcium exchanger protein-like protein isoform X1 [Tanacetum coccineum]|uniref:Mitochondrial proton/calcium exchanger protein-like protein isoform X1 n=1 Tax=Tanacetum coccineum TaxID=301880 RepID=A0ABQ4Z830_9ASTR